MTEALAILVVRLLGAYWIFTGIYAGGEFVYQYERQYSVVDPESGQELMMGVYAYAVLVFIGIISWVFSRPLARLLIGQPTGADMAIEADNLVAAGSFLIGLYWSATELPQALYMSFFLSKEYVGTAEVILPWMNVGIGVALMLGAGLIAGTFRSLRNWARTIEAD